jgi:hypothetical protein
MCELACVDSYHWRLDTTRLVSRVVGEPIAESRVVGEPLKQVGKYPCKYQGTSNNVTLPHVGSLDRSLATHVAVMTLEVILCQSFGECVSNLVFCVNREYYNKSLAYMFAKMMIAYVNMLCPRAKFRKSCEF